MNSSVVHPWATATFADTAATSPIELSALGAHVDRCIDSRGRWFKLQCAADAVLGFVTRRVVTTMVVVTVAFGIGALVL